MIKLVLLFLLCASSAWSTGQEIGNGGDSVQCLASKENPFKGLYSLDYLVTYQESNRNQDIVSSASVGKSMQRLRNNIASKLPEFLESFDEFTKLIANKDLLQPRFWEEAPFGLVDLKDENLIASVPNNCKGGGKASIIQTIIRQNPSSSGISGDKLIYKYIPKVVQELQAKNPIQLSFLLVHEWLWDLSHIVDRNRRINRFLHSLEFDQMNKAQVHTKLAALGLEFPQEFSPDVLRFDSCPANPAFAQKLAAQVRLQKSVKLAETFLGLVRQAVCRTDNVWGCPVSQQQIFEAGGPVSLSGDLLPEGIAVSLRDSGKYPVGVRCLLDEKTAQLQCGELEGDFYTSYRPNFIPAGRVGDGCIKIYQNSFRQTSNGGSLISQKRDIVLFSEIKW